MAEVTLDGVRKMFGSVTAVEDFTLSIGNGEFVVFVGPSGCGKSTTLRMLAGLEDVSSGSISIAGRAVNNIHPKDRDIAMVFQNYALYPHLNVFDNMSFGLRAKRLPRPEIQSRTHEAAEILGLGDLLKRRPGELSGGQKQRVAMGRAIVRQPKVFLFDEPLSNLDAKLRHKMRAEMKLLHQRVQTTTVYVTHDQIEAITLATRVAVMKDGIVQQFDTPQVVYDQPANTFVAGFIGSPAMNLIPVKLHDQSGRLHATVNRENDEPLKLEIHQPTKNLQAHAGSSILLGLRPEAFGDQDHAAGDFQAIRQFSSPVTMSEPTGPDMLARINLGGVEVTTRLHAAAKVQPGAISGFSVDMSKATFFDAASGDRI